MARIPEDQIEGLKQHVSLLRLIQSQGHGPKKQGKDWVMHCPFHDDKTPSLVISEKTNLWHCFGACGVGGSVIDWVMKTQGVSFRYACEILQTDVGLVAGSTKVVKQSRSKKLASPLVVDADDQELLHSVVDYYHAMLKQSPDALAYLEKRGLGSAELIDHFKLGYSNRTLGYRLPTRSSKAGADCKGRLQTLGILRASGHEHFTGSLVVPVINDGRVLEMYGRKINRYGDGTPLHLYLPGEHAGVWNSEALQASKEIILCEALIDAMTFWVNGFRHVTASYGANGFTPDHVAAFKKYGTQRVFIAYDRDDAGNAAAEKLATQLMTEGIECFRVLFPKNMDANEYALKLRPAEKSLGLAIRQAQWLGRGKSSALTRQAPALPQSPSPLAAVLEENADTLDEPEPEPPARSAGAMEVVALPAPAGIDREATPLIEAQVDAHEIHLRFDDRQYRVRGLEKNSSEQLRINLLVKRGERFHLDQLDLYSSKQRVSFTHQASIELGLRDDILKSDLGKVLLKLEEIQEEQRQQARAQAAQSPVKTLDRSERDAALALLQTPDLLQRLLDDFKLAGMVGEETNKLVGYLACLSRKLEKPLAVMIQSSSAAGKSSLMESVLAFMPEEERVQYSAMTGQSLFYMGATSLKHKILAIAEEEGAHNASYALKLLQSEGEVTIASTGKDDSTGNLITKEYKVEGPVMLLMTTTAIDIDEELMNRCLVLSVNESREQTQAIHRAQRLKRTLAGLQVKLEKERVLQLHRNAQRLLRPLAIINPYADQLTFLDDKTRTRRDHEKYLTLIDTIALLHQHQRKINTVTHNGEVIDYIEVTPDDIAAANRLAHEVLGKTLDELPPQTRKLLKLIQQMVREACSAQRIEQSHYRFSRKTVRDYTGWGNTQLKLHCHRLEEMEYLLVHRGGRGQSFDYELLYSTDAPDTDNHLMGLLDVEKLTYDTKKSGLNGQKSGLERDKSGSSRPQVGGMSGADRGAETDKNPDKNSAEYDLLDSDAENARLAVQNKNPVASYRTDSVSVAAAVEG